MLDEILVLIPSRYESQRFPGKPLAKILGRPMIDWVLRGASQGWAKYSPTIALVTDHDKIFAQAKELGHKVVRVDDDVSSGSERIALALDRFFKDSHFKYVINVQGDEPLIRGEDLEKLIDLQEKSQSEIATVVRERNDEEGFNNPDIVKVVYRKSDNQCLYFSRAQVPFQRDKNKELTWHQHVGIYSYKPEALKRFSALSPSPWEKSESLEQLRALENNMSIFAITIDKKLIGVDRPEDIENVEKELCDEKK